MLTYNYLLSQIQNTLCTCKRLWCLSDPYYNKISVFICFTNYERAYFFYTYYKLVSGGDWFFVFLIKALETWVKSYRQEFEICMLLS